METAKDSLNMTFDWLERAIGQSVIKGTSAYFENNFTMALVECNDLTELKDDPVLSGELFYTCRISIKNKQHIILRVTSDFIRIVFHDMFGSNSPVFDLEKLTELERMILNNFFEHLVKNIETYLIKETNADKIDPLNKTNLNFVFLVKNKDVNAGKMSINIPANRLSPSPVILRENFSNEDFINTPAYVDIEAGISKISLNDLKSLSKDDILVLEKSNSKIMHLRTQTVSTEIKVNTDSILRLEAEGEDLSTGTDFDNYKEINMQQDNKTMWDDIQIEVAAEFKRVKMTLGELKQISKGLVIDLGPIMKNEISLMVENKAVAKGELVIINDKYGVKINEVFATKKPEPAPQAAPQAPQAPQGQAPVPQRPQAPQGVPQQGAPQARPQGAAPQAPRPQAPQGGAQPRPQGAPAQGVPQRPQGAPPPQGAAQPRPQAPQGQAPAPQRPQGAPQPRPQAPQGAPQAPQRPQPAQAGAKAKDDFDYSNFEE